MLLLAVWISESGYSITYALMNHNTRNAQAHTNKQHKYKYIPDTHTLKQTHTESDPHLKTFPLPSWTHLHTQIKQSHFYTHTLIYDAPAGPGDDAPLFAYLESSDLWEYAIEWLMASPKSKMCTGYSASANRHLPDGWHSWSWSRRLCWGWGYKMFGMVCLVYLARLRCVVIMRDISVCIFSCCYGCIIVLL